MRRTINIISKEALSGLRVQIAIEEDGTPNPPRLPLGTIIRSVAGTDGVTYYLVRLDRPVRCLRAETSQEWNLYDLVIAPHFKGGSLEALSLSKDLVHVAIANALRPIEQDDPLLDFSKVAYFALGTAKRS